MAARTDPWELHFIASHCDWDSHVDSLLLLSDHPHLDKGTALYLFWLSEPPEGDDDKDDDEPGDVPSEQLDLIDRLRARLLEDDFTSRVISVDPRADLQFNRLGLELLRRRGVPAVLREATPGRRYDEVAFLRDRR